MKHELFYTKSASCWEEALPIGNGHMGAVIYGGAERDLIRLNNETLWSGKPHQEEITDKSEALKEVRKLIKERDLVKATKLADKEFCEYMCSRYFPMGDITLQSIHYFTPKTYNRKLDMSTGTVEVKINDIYRINYYRRAYVSYPKNVMVVDMTYIKHPEDDWYRSMSYVISTESMLQSDVSVDGKCITVKGRAFTPISNFLHSDIDFEYTIYVETDGEIIKQNNSIGVYDAQRITLYIASETNFVDWKTNPDKNKDLHKICLDRINDAVKMGADALYEEHVKDFQSLYNRVSLDISGEETEHIPTDERIKNYDENDKGLQELLFNYGRYLMISASRPGSQAMNLQGIWNHRMNPPWSCNYTTNINTEMNYWPAEICNLSDCHMPLFDMLKELSESGKKTAKMLYGCRGFAVHHNTDVWRKTTPSNGEARWALWPMAGVWMCQHLWSHYEHTLDKKFLKEFAYPIMKEACLFILDFLCFNGEYHVTIPSTSPENIFIYKNDIASVHEMSTMDLTLIKELFRNYKYMMNELGEEDEILPEIDKIKLPPFRIGSDGRLLEYSEEFEEVEKGYRHLSHLYGMFPSDIIFEEGGEVLEAAKKSLDYRLKHGSGYTGWSCGWIINLFAVLKNKEEAQKYINTIFKQSTYPNMMDSHPPFQIDGNFGYSSGVARLLMQSKKVGDEIKIEILPCLPKLWNKGSVKGLCAKGNIELDISWENGKAQVKVNSKSGMKYKLVSDFEIKEI